MKDEIILCQANESSTRIEVRIYNDTVWLNIEEISYLFDRDRTVINRHINNIFKEEELNKDVVCAFFAHTTQHGAMKGKTQNKNLEYFNLDVIISVGYRVKSKQGTQFRIWANKILKDYLLKGYAISQRFERIENDVHHLKSKIEEIDFQIQTNLPPQEGIFFEGQVFDAYVFFSEIIKKAQNEIILIDNYIDESVLSHLSKRYENVSATIYTKKITQQILHDLEKHNQQYPQIKIKQLLDCHDRFIVADRRMLYHLGASLKDLGKKWFAFSRMDYLTNSLLDKLNKL